MFVHVGKCAGESILRGIARCFGNSIDLFHYHSFDANRLLRELLLAEKEMFRPGQEPLVLIATRDPLERWFSSFNWDLHDLHLSRSSSAAEGYHRFPRASALAAAVARGEPEALAFARTNHMGMGLSWYLPQELLAALARHRVVEIRQEHAREDFRAFVEDYSAHMGFSLHRMLKGLLQRGDATALPRTKDRYKDLYPPGTFASPQECDIPTLEALRAFLRDDYAVARGVRQIATPLDH